MKKNYALLSGLVLASCVTFAQNRAINAGIPAPDQPALSATPTSVDPAQQKNSAQTLKTLGTVIYSEDFGSGTATTPPTGWTVFNNNNATNNFEWVWNDVYQAGQFSGTTTVLNSLTPGNGFMVLTGDFFNTPIPITGAVAMDTYFESPTITVTNPGTPVWLEWWQSIRYCCSGANRLVIQVSTDNFVTNTEYDATNGIAVNAGYDGVNYVNISSGVGSATTFKIRVLSEGNSHYYWMFDDLFVIEGADNDMQVDDPYLEFNFDYVYNPFYWTVPYAIFPPLPVSGLIRNNGGNTATGVSLEVDILHESFPGGAAGQGLVYSAASTPVTMPSSASLNDTSYYIVAPDTALGPGARFVPTVLGEFTAELEVVMDSIDQWDSIIGIHTYTQTFNTGDSIYQRVDNTVGGGTGPGSYVRAGQTGGQLPGDAFGTMFVVESPASVTDFMKTPTSLSYIVSTDAAQVGVEISPTIWAYDEDSLNVSGIAGAFNGVVASSFVPYTIQAADIGNTITLPLDNGSAVFSGLPDGQYVAGWTVVNTNGGNNFEVQADASTGQFQDPVTCFIDLAHSPGWGWVNANPAININMAMLPLPTSVRGVVTSNTAFEIAPNPNNGEFKLTVASTEQVTYDLNVRNVLGQSVYTDNISVNGTYTEQMDLTQFEKGVYFVSLENGTERLLKKVVVR